MLPETLSTMLDNYIACEYYMNGHVMKFVTNTIDRIKGNELDQELYMYRDVSTLYL